MLEKINVFQRAIALASHSGARQAVLAQNIANADTPKYKPKDITPFQLELPSHQNGVMKASRPTHLSGNGQVAGYEVIHAESSEMDPNGNAVNLEEEMLKSVAAKREHDRALAIYKSGLKVMRSSIRSQ